MVAVNITLNAILVRYMQAAGLTLATSIAFFVYFVTLFILFRRKCGAFGGLALAKNIGKCMVATASMVPMFLLFELLRHRLRCSSFLRRQQRQLRFVYMRCCCICCGFRFSWRHYSESRLF